MTGSYPAGARPDVRDPVFPDGVTRLTGFTILGMVVAFAPLVVLLGSSFVMKQPDLGRGERPLLG